MQVVCEDLHDDWTLLHAVLRVLNFFSALDLLVLVLSDEDKTLTLISWCDENHVHDIFLKRFIVGYLLKLLTVGLLLTRKMGLKVDEKVN